jgi:hypothetical protein
MKRVAFSLLGLVLAACVATGIGWGLQNDALERIQLRLAPPGESLPIALASVSWPTHGPSSRAVYASTSPDDLIRHAGAPPAVTAPGRSLLIAALWTLQPDNEWFAFLRGHTLIVHILSWGQHCSGYCAIPPLYHLATVPLERLPRGPLTVSLANPQFGQGSSTTIDVD